MGLKKTHSPDPLHEVVERAHPRDAQGLLTQLREGDIEQRRWAARDLAGQHTAVVAMGERLLAEPEPRVREALFTTLTGMPTEATVTVLLPLLRSEDASLRNGAIEALAAMPRAVGPRIAALLNDADPDVRIFTVNLFGELRHDLVPQWLVQVMAQDAEVNVVAAAIEVLAEVGAPEHVGALRSAARRFAGDPFIGFAAQVAEQRIQAG